MNKFILGTFIAIITTLSGILYTVLNKPADVVTVVIKPGTWNVTCNPTYNSVLKYKHFGAKPFPDLNNTLTLTNQFGEEYTLYNMQNCIIMKARVPADLSSILPPRAVPQNQKSSHKSPKIIHI